MKIKLIRLRDPVYLFLVTVITFIFDTCIIPFIRKSVQPHNVAIVRLDNIGDFILWLDAAKEFRNLYPKIKITLIANQVWSSLASLLPYWDDVITMDLKKLISNPIYRFQTFRLVRQHGFESAIQPTFSRDFRLGDSLIRATGALHRIGSVGDLSNMTAWQKMISDKWYSQLLPATTKPQTELERNAEFMSGLSLLKFSANVPSLPKLMNLPTKLTIRQPYFVIFPGAFWDQKMWSAVKFGEVLSKLTESNGGLAVLCGSREERYLCAQIIDSSGMEALNLAGETSLPELVEVIRRAKILVGNDTSGVHIAAAVGTPSVCILGGGHYGRFIPYMVEAGDHIAPVPVIHRMDCYGCNWQCTQPHEKGIAVPCISHITVDQVLEAIEEIFVMNFQKVSAKTLDGARR